MRRIWTLIILFIIAIGSVWYTHEKEISSIKLECSADLCKRLTPIPFEQKTFKDADELKKFRHAASKAVRMQGEIDYGVMFWMYVSYNDGTQKKFVLNVADEDGKNALLVDTEDSGEGYSIPKEQTNELRKIIYNG